MKLRPFKTLPLRVRLKKEGRANALSRARQLTISEVEKPLDVQRRVDSRGYLVVEIHPYAQLGHQVASWISGYLWARDLGLDYIGGHLSRDQDRLFDFRPFQAAPPEGAKIVRLPATHDETEPTSLDILNRAVNDTFLKYPSRTIVFRLAMDQGRFDQTPAAETLRGAVLNGRLGSLLRERELTADFAAVHIRRASFKNDISKTSNPDRWIDEDWYVQLITDLRDNRLWGSRPVRIYAMGEPENFPTLASMQGVRLILNGDRDEDMIDMCSAKLLVAAPSSFSFNAALVSRAPVMARVPWWHRVPDFGRWNPIEADGSFSLSRLSEALEASGQTQT